MSRWRRGSGIGFDAVRRPRAHRVNAKRQRTDQQRRQDRRPRNLQGAEHLRIKRDATLKQGVIAMGPVQIGEDAVATARVHPQCQGRHTTHVPAGCASTATAPSRSTMATTRRRAASTRARRARIDRAAPGRTERHRQGHPAERHQAGERARRRGNRVSPAGEPDGHPEAHLEPPAGERSPCRRRTTPRGLHAAAGRPGEQARGAGIDGGSDSHSAPDGRQGGQGVEGTGAAVDAEGGGRATPEGTRGTRADHREVAEGGGADDAGQPRLDAARHQGALGEPRRSEAARRPRERRSEGRPGARPD